MRTTHTPGPWFLLGGMTPADTVIISASGGVIDGFGNPKTPATGGPIPVDEHRANARLIAAAPDMYRELTHLVKILEPLERDGFLDVPGLATLNGARAAIALAEKEGDRP